MKDPIAYQDRLFLRSLKIDPDSAPAEPMVSAARWSAERDEKDRLTLKLIDCERHLRSVRESRERWRFFAIFFAACCLGGAIAIVSQAVKP